MIGDAHKQFDVFLSHSHVDAEAVEALGSRLEDEASFVVWLDKWILVPGAHWQQELAKGLEEAKTCAVCIGKSTPKGWFKEEIEKALNRQTKEASFRVIPVVLPLGDSSYINDFLELRTWVEFKNGIDDPDAFHLLTCGVKGVPPGRLHKPIEALDSEQILIRESLARIRAWRREQLIDDEIALEYQRKILDQSVLGRGKK
jgi:TIR domain